jgi:hypothetical protein
MHGGFVVLRPSSDHLSWRPTSRHRPGSICITYAKRYSGCCRYVSTWLGVPVDRRRRQHTNSRVHWWGNRVRKHGLWYRY